MSISLSELQAKIRSFRDARDWVQFHNPKNLAISISLEASELLEHFQWRSFEESAAHAIGSQLGRQIIRGVLGSLFGGGRRR